MKAERLATLTPLSFLFVLSRDDDVEISKTNRSLLLVLDLIVPADHSWYWSTPDKELRTPAHDLVKHHTEIDIEGVVTLDLDPSYNYIQLLLDMALPMLQPAFMMQASSISSSTCTQPARTPSPEYIATRLHSISNYKLRLESSQNEPKLRKLLGHIFIYDAVREHHQAQQSLYTHTTPTASRRREQQLQRRQQSEASRQQPPPLSPVHEDESPEDESSSTNEEDIKSYLSTLPDSSQQGLLDFQTAIAAQLATLSQLRLENASRQLYQMTQGEAEDDDLAVEEYDSEDIEDSDYDSYDGDENDWRFEDEDGQTENGDSDSEPPSPTTEEPLCVKGSMKDVHEGSYFLPLGPTVDLMV